MDKNNILVFTCFSERSIHMESTVLYFKNKGYNVFFLTTCAPGPIHKELTANGVIAEGMDISRSPGIGYYVKLIKALIKYSKKNRIGFIHSHLQIPNFISSISGYFIRTVVFNTRHNSDVIELSGSFKEKFIEKIINRLSRHIIAISDKVKTQLIEKENVDPRKIHRINNGYNFSEYEKLSHGIEKYLDIRKNYPAQFLIVSPGRLIKTKRHELTILGVKELHQKGYDVKLLILGDGPERNMLSEFITDNTMQNSVYLLGYIENISDYLKASDVVVLLSESEASSNIVKEAGYFEKPVIVCENVGDFSDYIQPDFNGYLVAKLNPLPQFVKSVEYLYSHNEFASFLGSNLKATVITEFDINSVGAKYEELQNSL